MKALILTLALSGACFVAFSQGSDKKSAVIGTLISRPNAILVLNPPNSDQGFLLPQLTTSQRLSIVPASPDDDGLVVFDITEKSFYYWSANTWVKGLGASDDQVLNYDAASQTLTLSSGGGLVNLSALKEIPAPAGNTGKFLTTDGTTLSWANVSAFGGDITSVIAGQGLTGGATSGDATLSVNMDGTTISVNGTNQLQLSDGAITPQKIQPDGNDKVLGTDASGAVTWIDRSSFVDDNQSLSLQAGNLLNIDNGTGVDLDGITAGGQVTGPINNLTVADGAITNPKLAPDAVGTANIQDKNVTPDKIQPGANDQILITIGGTVAWADQDLLTPNVAVDNVTIVGNGTAVTPFKVGDNSLTSNQIGTGAVGTDELSNGSVSTQKISDGAVTGIKLANDAVTSPAILDNSVTGADIQNNTITNADLAVNSVNETNIASGGNNRVLTTDGTGTVTWADRSTFDDDQGLSLTGNTLNIDNGAAANLNNLTAAGQVSGTLNNLVIADGAVTTLKLANNAVESAQLADDAVDGAAIQDNAVNSSNLVDAAVTPVKIQAGSNGQVLVTSGTAVAWADQNTLVPTIAVDGITITGSGTAADKLAVGTISSGNIPDNTIITNDIADDAVNGNKLADNAVTSLHIADGTVTGTDIQDGSVENADLGNDVITTDKLAPSSVRSTDIQDLAVTPAKIEPGGSNQILITNGAGTNAMWVNQSVLTPTILVDGTSIVGDGTTTDLAGNIAGSNIIDGSIESEDISNSTIATIDLADNAVDANKLAANAVTSAKIADGSVISDDLQDATLEPVKFQPGAPNQVLVTNATGTSAEWANQNTLIPAITVDNATITGNGSTLPLAVNTISGLNISDGTVETADLEDDAVNGAKLADNAVTTTHIADGTVSSADIQDGVIANADLAANSVAAETNIISGGVSKVLTTDGAGAVAWIDRTTFNDDNQNLALSGGNILSIDDGTSADLNALTATGPQIQGRIDALAIVDGTVTSADIQDNGIATVDIADDAVDGTKLADNAVTTAHIVDGTITSADIQDGVIVNADLAANSVEAETNIISGGVSKVLTTDGTGAVAWIDRTTFNDDNQNLALSSGNILSIDGGASVDLNAVTATGPQIQGRVDALSLVDGTVTSAKIQDNSIATADIADDAVNIAKLADNSVTTTHIVDGTIASIDILDETITSADILNNTIATADLADKSVTVAKIQQGTANQLMATDATGTNAVWIDRTTLPSAGDVTGTLGATTVARIQGRTVSGAAPNVGEALIWDGANWIPTVVTPSPTVQYYAVDPSAFQPLEPGGNTATILGLWESDDRFVFAKGAARELMAPVNLPHGAVVTNITVYFEYLLLGAINVEFDRKSFGGANEVLSSLTTPLISLGIQNTSMTIGTVANRTVNNATYSYRIKVEFTNLLPQNAPGAAQRIHGIRIEYTK